MVYFHKLALNLKFPAAYFNFSNQFNYVCRNVWGSSTNRVRLMLKAKLSLLSSASQSNQVNHQAQFKNKTAPQLAKKRSRKIETKPSSKESSIVTAFSTANEYNLEEISSAMLRNHSYLESIITDDVEDVLLFKKKNHESGLIYLFREGSIVFWDIEMNEMKEILHLIRLYEFKPYKESVINEEMDQMDFRFTEGKSKIQKNVFYVSKEERALSQYTFSNALSLSVKLSIWEAALDQYIESIKFVPEDIKDGKRIQLTRHQVFQKTGELFDLRHHINLSSDLLDTPDFYWDRQDLESLFLQTCSSLNISKRTKIINEKLNHCSELMMLIGHHLDDKHHARLEWMIIILIMVEVVFEIIHYLEKS